MSRIMKKPDDRRRELLNIGFDLYMEKGMEGLNIKEVVDRANVATGLFYYYFKSKEEFVEEALNNFIVQNLEPAWEILESEQTALEKLDAVLAEFFKFADRVNPYVGDKAYQSKQHYAFINQLLGHMFPVVEQVIAAGNREGAFHVKHTGVTAGYILYGLSGILNVTPKFDSDKNEVIRELVYASLGIPSQAAR